MGGDRWEPSVAVAGVLVALVLTAGLGALVVRTAAGAAASLGRGPVVLAAAPSPVALPERFRAAGYTLPRGASVYAAQVLTSPGGSLRLVEYEAGGGANGGDFWPASSVKVMVALGALDFLRTLGFTGAATVQWPSGWSTSVRALINDAIDDSANDAYDLLVQIAGLDRLNTSFLSPANGFSDTVIQRSYAGYDIHSSPQLLITEGPRSVTVPARSSSAVYDCPQWGNCSTLHDMAESIRRVILHDELPPAQRFNVDRSDIRALAGALLAAEGWMDPGVARALGIRARVSNKPGFASGLDCLDVGLVEDVATRRRFVLAMTVPVASAGDQGCEVLAGMAEAVLEALVT
jgi:hypothetical protein